MRFVPPLLIFLALISEAQAGPVDDLLRLVPQDAGATLVVEDLRGHAKAFFDSPLAEGLAAVPAIRDWRNSEGSRRLGDAGRDIERALGMDLKSVRDELLGDVLVLAVHADPAADPREPRGLVLTKARDRVLLERLIRVLNAAQKAGGELIEVARREHGRGGTYFHRRFQPGAKADSWYAIVGESTFAWSNSEALIRGVIDRQAGRTSGLDSHPEVRRVRSGLPGGSIASLLIDPKFVGRLIDAGASTERRPGGTPSRLRSYLRAIRFAGVALEWRDGLIAAHVHATYDVNAVPEPHRRWAKLAAAGPPPAMPADALAFASIPVDFSAMFDLLFTPFPGQDRDRVANTLTAVNGLLGRDLKRDVLPWVRPNLRFLVRNPGPLGGRPPMVLAVGLDDDGGRRGVASAIDNALRTTLAFVALGATRAGRGGLVESADVRGVRVTRLDGPPPVLSFSVDRGQLAFGNHSDAVAWVVGADRAAPTHPGFDRARAAYFPEASGFAFVDLDAWVAWASARRPAIIDWLAVGRGESKASAARDLDSTMAIGALFGSAFATGSVSPGFEEAHIRVGLIVKGAKGEK